MSQIPCSLCTRFAESVYRDFSKRIEMAVLDGIFDRTVPALQKVMDLTWKRHKTIASNIANADTPQYRAMKFDFGAELDKAFQRHRSDLVKTNSLHMDLGESESARIVPDLSGATKADGNNVDIDIQFGKLLQNSGKYNNAAAILRKKLRMMRMAIRFAQR
ncbi:MAG: flagellar basal body rod protein FlgB [Candidatus Dadabacteria bacterium]|nr:MAG: flagellar basal body rod protein FlgB [Candidatus Dadabacteria bacterium]